MSVKERHESFVTASGVADEFGLDVDDFIKIYLPKAKELNDEISVDEFYIDLPDKVRVIPSADAESFRYLVGAGKLKLDD